MKAAEVWGVEANTGTVMCIYVCADIDTTGVYSASDNMLMERSHYQGLISDPDTECERY